MATVTCIAPGLSVAGIDQARTFAPGDVIDPEAVVALRPGGVVVTWRDVLGPRLETHFAPAAPVDVDETEPAADVSPEEE